MDRKSANQKLNLNRSSKEIETKFISIFRRPRGRPPTAPTVASVSDYDSSSALSNDERKEHKYRRMRDLNNAASKRCRIRRKRKHEEMEDEVRQLETENAVMKVHVEELEQKVAKFKEAIFGMIKKKKKVSSTVTSATLQQQPQEEENLDFNNLDFDISMLIN